MENFFHLLTPADPSKVYYHRGLEFKQSFQLFPSFPGFYSQAEANFEPDVTKTWMVESPWVPLTAVALYLAFCYFGPKVMDDRKPFGLRQPLVLWNLLLSIFSTIGFFRTAPHLLFLLYSTSFRSTICEEPKANWGAGATGLWVQLFILSKIPELGDTLFVVLKKKPLIFLHWYHHATVLLFCWHSYVTESGSGLYFITMNYAVHAIMYGYYAAMALRLPMKWFPVTLLTALQILQMVIGVAVVSFSIYYVHLADRPCRNDVGNLCAGSVMYFSYLLLFVHFFVEKYILKRTPSLAPQRAKKVE